MTEMPIENDSIPSNMVKKMPELPFSSHCSNNGNVGFVLTQLNKKTGQVHLWCKFTTSRETTEYNLSSRFLLHTSLLNMVLIQGSMFGTALKLHAKHSDIK